MQKFSQAGSTLVSPGFQQLPPKTHQSWSFGSLAPTRLPTGWHVLWFLLLCSFTLGMGRIGLLAVLLLFVAFGHPVKQSQVSISFWSRCFLFFLICLDVYIYIYTKPKYEVMMPGAGQLWGLDWIFFSIAVALPALEELQGSGMTPMICFGWDHWWIGIGEKIAHETV